MTRVPSLTGRDLVRLLHKAGFKSVRQRGSHLLLRHADGRRTVVPVHAGETIGPGLFHKILRDLDMTVDQLLRLTKEV